MKQIQLNSGEFLLVEVPEDAKDVLITNAHVDNDLVYPNQYGTFNHIAMIPPGQWEIIGKGNEITEEVWEEIIDGWNEATGGDDYQETYKNYEIKNTKDLLLMADFKTPTESGHSWIKSHGMKPECLVILKLKK